MSNHILPKPVGRVARSRTQRSGTVVKTGMFAAEIASGGKRHRYRNNPLIRSLTESRTCTGLDDRPSDRKAQRRSVHRAKENYRWRRASDCFDCCTRLRKVEDGRYRWWKSDRNWKGWWHTLHDLVVLRTRPVQARNPDNRIFGRKQRRSWRMQVVGIEVLACGLPAVLFRLPRLRSVEWKSRDFSALVFR